MIVELIAHTTIVNEDAMFAAGWTPPPGEPDREPGFQSPKYTDQLAEFAGRLCYQSWARPNPDTRMNSGYLNNILTQRHFSVLEHASATFYVAGVSRSFSHELVRHRHLSFSQVSQRYVAEDGALAVIPPAIEAEDERQRNGLALSKIVGKHMNDSAIAYAQLVHQLTGAGLSRKEARQAARAVLPNATETKLVVTGNMRAWREVIEKRISSAADAEMQAFAREVLRHLLTVAPSTFQDFTALEPEVVTEWNYEQEGFGGT